MKNKNIIFDMDITDMELYNSCRRLYSDRIIKYAECNPNTIPLYIRSSDFIHLVCKKMYDYCKKYNKTPKDSAKKFLNIGYLRTTSDQCYYVEPIVKIGQSSDGERRNSDYLKNTEGYGSVKYDKIIKIMPLINIKGDIITDKQIVKILSNIYYVKFEKDDIDNDNNSDEKIYLLKQDDPRCPISKGKTIEERGSLLNNLVEYIVGELQQDRTDFVVDRNLLKKHNDRFFQLELIDTLYNILTNPLNYNLAFLESLCRSGKSHICMSVSWRMGLKRVLITSNVVNSEEGFKTDVTCYSDYCDYYFYTQKEFIEDSLEEVERKFKTKKYLVLFLSLPYLKTVPSKDKEKKLRFLKKQYFDLIIMDEFHSAGLTTKTLSYFNTYISTNEYKDEKEFLQNVDEIKRNYTLVCTATPENAKAAGIMHPGNTAAFNEWSYLKRICYDYDLEDERLPELLIFPFRISMTMDISNTVKEIKNIKEISKIDTEEGLPFDFKEFTKYDPVNKRYVYYPYIKDFFTKLFTTPKLSLLGNINDIKGAASFANPEWINGIINNFQKEFPRFHELNKIRSRFFLYADDENKRKIKNINFIKNNIMIYVDGVGQGKCLEDIFNSVDDIYKKYIIINIAGDEYCGCGHESLDYIKQKIHEAEQKEMGYIIITCGKCIAGTTIPTLATIIRFDNCQSVPSYIQTNFRNFSDCRDKETQKYKKEYSLLLDLNFQRQNKFNYSYALDILNERAKSFDSDVNLVEEKQKCIKSLCMVMNGDTIFTKDVSPYYTIEELNKYCNYEEIEVESVVSFARQHCININLTEDKVVECIKNLGYYKDFDNLNIEDKNTSVKKVVDAYKNDYDLRKSNDSDIIENPEDSESDDKKCNKNKKKENYTFEKVKKFLIYVHKRLFIMILVSLCEKNKISKIKSILDYKNDVHFKALFNEFVKDTPFTFDDYIRFIEDDKYRFVDRRYVDGIITRMRNIWISIGKDTSKVYKIFKMAGFQLSSRSNLPIKKILNLQFSKIKIKDIFSTEDDTCGYLCKFLEKRNREHPEWEYTDHNICFVVCYTPGIDILHKTLIYGDPFYNKKDCVVRLEKIEN